MLASGRNLRSFGRALVERCPGRSVLLVDLPGHGETAERGIARDARTVAACAEQVQGLVTQLAAPVDVAIGHSFGGKVAALLSELLPLDAAWLLDTPPGVDPKWQERSDVATVIRALESAPVPSPDRAGVARALETRGLPHGVAEWLTTNLRRTDAGYDWVFEFDHIRALAGDYFRVDLLQRLAQRADGPTLHLLRAEHGARWNDEDLRRAELLPVGIELHLLADSGHWVHADNLPGLLEVITRSVR